MPQIVEHLAGDGDSGKRLDVYLSETGELSRSRAAALIEAGAVSADGKVEVKASCKVQAGRLYRVEIPEARETDMVAQDIPLTILYQDADIAVIDKPCGMVVHPAAGNENGTLVNALLYHVRDLSGIGGEMRPGIVHRLDKDTSGVLVVAKNDYAHARLCEQFKARTMEKIYTAVAYGHFAQESGLIDAPIGRHPTDRKRMAVVPDGRPSRTQWFARERLGVATLLSVRLLTGRTHQIRVHMKSIGHPLLGDRIYAPNLRLPVHVPRLMLHASSITFDHPVTGERMRVESLLPQDFLATIDKLR